MQLRERMKSLVMAQQPAQSLLIHYYNKEAEFCSMAISIFQFSDKE